MGEKCLLQLSFLPLPTYPGYTWGLWGAYRVVPEWMCTQGCPLARWGKSVAYRWVQPHDTPSISLSRIPRPQTTVRP